MLNFSGFRQRSLTLQCVLFFAVCFFIYKILQSSTVNRELLQSQSPWRASQVLFSNKKNSDSELLHIFGQEDFERNGGDISVNQKNCLKIKALQPSFTLCLHEKAMDGVVSGSFYNGGAWEGHLASVLHDALDQYHDAVFVDVGGHIGCHLLFAAKSGAKVYAVEPLTVNLMHIFKAALIEKTSSRITLFKNAIDWERGVVSLSKDPENLGASFVDSNVQGDRLNKIESVKSVLLSDVFNFVLFDSRSDHVTAVLKLDIEGFECRAVLGSPEVFSHPAIRIPYVAMEWFFRLWLTPGHPKATSCPVNLLQQVVELFLKNGYRAYGETDFDSNIMDFKRWKKMDENDFLNWPPTNILWVSQDAPLPKLN